MRLLAAMLFLIPLCAQQAPDGAPPKDAPPKREMGPPKNLKILKPGEVRPTMRLFAQSLGVRCDYCHVRGDMASDEKPEKQTARKMLTMVRQLDSDYFNAHDRVTCYTCHRGAEEPAKVPPAATEKPAP